MTANAWSILALGGAVFLWCASLQAVDPRHMTDTGLVSVLPLSTYLSLIVLVVSFCLSLHRRPTPEAILLLHVGALVIMLHSTPAIVYETLRYSWAWKHVGIVDYIQRHHSLDPDITVLSAYHNWPGFFSLISFATEISSEENPLMFATWAPVFFDLLYLGALLFVFQSLTRDRRLVWFSVWLFFLTNWVGQDYFSPQAYAYFLHLVILGICLRWFGADTRAREIAQPHSFIHRTVSLLGRLVKPGANDHIPEPNVRPLERAGLIAIVTLLFMALSSSHQLTPFMTITSITGLVVFRRCSATGLPVLMTVIAVSWLVYGARSFLIDDLSSLLGAVGHVSENLNDNLTDLSRATSGQKLVATMGRTLSAILWGMAVVGGLRRLRLGYRDVSGVVLTVAPFATLMGTAYGGEVIFRIYFFGLPFAAFFAAALIYASASAGTSTRAVVSTVFLSCVLLSGFGFAHYGKDRQYHFTKGEVAAANFLYNTAPPGSLIIEGSRSYPTQFRNYEFFTYVPIDREPRETQLRIVEDPVKALSRWMTNERYSRAYLFVTRSQKADDETLGALPPGSLDFIEDALSASRKFEVIYENEDAKIFVLARAISEMGQ